MSEIADLASPIGSATNTRKTQMLPRSQFWLIGLFLLRLVGHNVIGAFPLTVEGSH
jgi:hypothetical protein